MRDSIQRHQLSLNYGSNAPHEISMRSDSKNNPALLHKNKLSKVLHSFDDDGDNQSEISSIEEVKEPIENLSKD